MKTTIEVDGKEVEVELENLSKEEQEKYGINVSSEEPKTTKVIKRRKSVSKLLRILPFLVLIAFFLCGFLLEGWVWCWSFFLLIPFAHIVTGLFEKSAKTILMFII